MESKNQEISNNLRTIEKLEKTVDCYFDFIKKFGEKVTDFDKISFRNETVLQHACNSKDDELFKYLLSVYKDADIEIKNEIQYWFSHDVYWTIFSNGI